jgi:hypothetical protein
MEAAVESGGCANAWDAISVMAPATKNVFIELQRRQRRHVRSSVQFPFLEGEPNFRRSATTVPRRTAADWLPWGDLRVAQHRRWIDAGRAARRDPFAACR